MSCELIADSSEYVGTTEAVIEVSTTNSVVNTTVENSIVAEAQIQEWTICSDDIYLVEYGTNPPGWLEDMIENTIIDMNIPQSIADLDDLTANLEEGYHEFAYEYEIDKTQYVAHFDYLYVENYSNKAAITDLEVVWADEVSSGANWSRNIAAWETGRGGAWFNNSVSVISNVAYSAAKSASSITASMIVQSDRLDALQGDIDILEKQADGKIETFFVPNSEVTPGINYSITGPIHGDGSLRVDEYPYADWLAAGTVAEHTGDQYIWYEQIGDEKTILLTLQFGRDGSIDTSAVYNWFVFTDHAAQLAFEAALAAQETADGKINSYYQPDPPTLLSTNNSLGCGDLWTDSDGSGTKGTSSYAAENTLYRYQPTTGKCEATTTDADCSWIRIESVEIQASVKRLDEATVTVDGKAVARSSLLVTADAAIGGMIISAEDSLTGAPSSTVEFLADTFMVTDPGGAGRGNPFRIENGNIYFNGLVEFTNLEGVVQNSANIHNAMYSHFTDKSTPLFFTAGTSVVNINADDAARGGKSLTIYNRNTGDGYVYLGLSATDYNIKLEKFSKFRVSFWVASAENMNTHVYLRNSSGTHYQSTVSVTGNTQRVSCVVDCSTSPSSDYILRIDNDGSYNNYMRVQDIMIEKITNDDITEPSLYVLPLFQDWQTNVAANYNKTTIDGGKITTNTLSANKIMTTEAWIDGWIQSTNYNWNGTSGMTPQGFILTGDTTKAHGYNIVGGKIYGAQIDAVTMNTATLNATTLNSPNINFLNNWGKTFKQFRIERKNGYSSNMYAGWNNYNLGVWGQNSSNGVIGNSYDIEISTVKYDDSATIATIQYVKFGEEIIYAAPAVHNPGSVTYASNLSVTVGAILRHCNDQSEDCPDSDKPYMVGGYGEGPTMINISGTRYMSGELVVVALGTTANIAVTVHSGQ